MQITVVGAGAIGGFLACKLFASGHEVSVIARGATLAAINEHGLRLHSGDQTFVSPLKATSEAHTLGVQDVVIFAVKAPALPAVVEAARPLIGRETVVIPALNGLPWWYFLKSPGALSGMRLDAVDPEGRIEKAVPIDSVLGCVVFPSCAAIAPGVIRHMSGSKIVFGEPAGGGSQRCLEIAQVFQAAGFDVHASEDIHEEIWLKLLGNACFNPVSLLVGSSTDELIDDPALKSLFTDMMGETLALGAQIGIQPAISPEQRIGLTRKLGKVKTSMLQDLEANRPIEIEAILGTLVAVADRVSVPVPRLRAVYALARMRAKTLGLLPV